MKKVLTTATAIVFALGLTAAAQATPEKAKTGAEPKAATTAPQVQSKEAAKVKDLQAATTEVKPGEAAGKVMGGEAGQKEATAPSTAKEKGKEMKSEAGKEAQTGQPKKPETPAAPKTDKK